MELWNMKILSLILLLFTCNCHSKSIMNVIQKLQTNNGVQGNEKPVAGAVYGNKAEVENVAPPKHLDAVKFDRDGNINSNFHQEVFLGEDVEKFENGNYEQKEQIKKLKEIFHLIDVDNDKYLDVPELSSWVLKNTVDHFQEARHESKKAFIKIDADKDGKLSWKEYVVEFLGEKGFDRDVIRAKLLNKTKIEVDEKLHGVVEDTRDKWIQAASEDNTDYLTADEFLDFQHPEQSKASLDNMVFEFFHDMDMDNDEVLTVREYMAVALDVDVDSQTDAWGASRRDEFNKIIDQNHDGNVTKEELAKYLDPLSKYTSEQEALQLIAFGDENNDGKLSLVELLENSRFYTGSKLYNYARNVHEEF